MLYKDFSVNDVNNVIVDRDAIKRSIENILTTKKGSLAGKPEFGCGLHNFLFEILDYITINAMRDEISRALSIYEPRIKVNNINIYEQTEYNRIIIEIQYEYAFVRTDNYETFRIVLST